MFYIYDALTALLRGVLLVGGATFVVGCLCVLLAPSSPEASTGSSEDDTVSELDKLMALNSQLQSEKATLEQSLAQVRQELQTAQATSLQHQTQAQSLQEQLAQGQQALAAAQAELSQMRKGVRGLLNGSLNLLENGYRWYQAYLQGQKEKQSVPAA